MLNIILWYLIISLLGWLSFPITYRLLKKLPDRGFSVARPLALLLFAFIFWLLGSYGLLHNNTAGIASSLLILIALSVWATRGLKKGEIRKWLSDKALLLLTIESLFLFAFIAMALLRANSPGARFTEQPMEMAFINAILQSPGMPPNDPWLSGFSISYYYFGYLMVAMLATLSGVSGAIAFNLGLITVFAMGALGAYGLAFNILSLIRPAERRANVGAALLAPLFVLVLGNVEGFLEILHAQHVFWNVDAAGIQYSAFWSWLDIRDLVNPPLGEAVLQPRQYGTGSWWWWRASRVINDLSLQGFELEVIDEFPAFSFVLGDLHPHVLSIPFVFLAVQTALNLFLGGGERKEALPFLGIHIQWRSLLLATLVLGGLAFLNIWDFPIYLLLFAGAYAYRKALIKGWSRERLVDFLRMLVVVGIAGVLAYLPFYIGFSSQAAGFIPNLLNPTRGAHLWVMFGILLLPLFAYLFHLSTKKQSTDDFRKGFLLSAALIASLWILSFASAWIFANILATSDLGASILNLLGAKDMQSLFAEAFRRRFANPGGWITLLFLIAMLLGNLWPKFSQRRKEKTKPSSTDQGRAFLLLLALFAALLVLAPEFIFLRDQFGTRMNTVFKFYMQAGLLFASVAAIAMIVLLSELRARQRAFYGLFFALLIAMGLVYPIFAFTDRYRRVEDQALSLDASDHLSADESAAIAWLANAPLAPLVEAVGNSYNPGFARYATFSGQQGVLGWPGHEGQWRGDSVDFSPRIGDIETLYTTHNWDTANEILKKYEIRYLLLGTPEYNSYQVSEIKFENNLELVFQNTAVKIYLVP